MVELFINLTISIIASFTVITVAIILLFALKIFMDRKDKQHNINTIPKEANETLEENTKEEEQIDYVEKVYQLVDDVLTGKKELDMGDNDNEA